MCPPAALIIDSLSPVQRCWTSPARTISATAVSSRRIPPPQAGMQPTPGRSGRGVLGILAWRVRTGGTIEPIPEDWERAVAVVAHPDDLEYRAASAVARGPRPAPTASYLIVAPD